jgi:hypothetical protein
MQKPQQDPHSKRGCECIGTYVVPAGRVDPGVVVL